MNVCFPIHLMVTLRRRKGKLREGLCSRAMYRIAWLYLTKSAYRKAFMDMAKDARNMLKHFKKYYGYGIYVGRKPL